MSLSVGIVGFPNVGKSTLFRIITKKQVECANYAFCTIDPNVGLVYVPDERIEEISKVVPTKKKIYSTVEFIDIAGIVEGASQGKGLGNKFLSHIRETNLIVYVLRAFNDKDVMSTRENINPLEEADLLETELILKDLEVIEKRILSLEKDVRSKNKEAVFDSETLKKAKCLLEKSEILINGDFNEKEKKVISNYCFLTFKPRIYLINGRDNEVSEKIKKDLKEKDRNFIIIDIKEEESFFDLTKQERIDAGLPEFSKIDELIKDSYNLLNLITFFTAGPEEIRAWKIKKGVKAPEAAGVIHTDFEKGFIKADVINYKELVSIGGYVEARRKGLIKTEGKEYIINDGDIIEIKFRKN